MRSGHAARLLQLTVVTVALFGCAGGRIEGNAFRSAKGYRVTLPPGDWVVADRSRADLELRHRTAPAAILVNAACGGRARDRSLDVLRRHLLLGLRDRLTLERDEVTVAGHRAAHTVLDARVDEPGGRRTRVEAYVLKDARCVYDLVYVAPPGTFDTWRGAFRGLVESLSPE